MKILTLTLLVFANIFLSLQWFAHEGEIAILNQKNIKLQSSNDSLFYSARVQGNHIRDWEIAIQNFSKDLKSCEARNRYLESQLIKKETESDTLQ